MSLNVLQFPVAFLPHEEYLIDGMLKCGHGIGPIPEKTRLMYCALADEGYLPRLELVFGEVQRRAATMLEAGDGYF